MLRRISFLLCLLVGLRALAQSAPPEIAAPGAPWVAHAGYPFNAAIAAANAPTSYAAAGLPRGLTCNATTGAITGVTASYGEFTLTLTATNAHGTATATHTLNISGPGPIEMPVVTGVTAPPAGQYRAGDTLSFSVAVDAPYSGVRVTGQPGIALQIGGATRYAACTGVSGDGPRPVLNFSYELQAGDAAPQGIVLGNSIEQNGGTIRDSAGLHCALGLPEVGTSGIIVVASTGLSPATHSLGLAVSDAASGFQPATVLPFVLAPLMFSAGPMVYEVAVEPAP